MLDNQVTSDEEKQDNGEGFVQKQRKRNFSYTQVLAILLLILQSLFIIRLGSTDQGCFATTSPNEALIERKWHRNTSYMSLDHAYDGLWNETGQSALVYDDEKNVVQITMQVQAPASMTGSSISHVDK